MVENDLFGYFEVLLFIKDSCLYGWKWFIWLLWSNNLYTGLNSCLKTFLKLSILDSFYKFIKKVEINTMQGFLDLLPITLKTIWIYNPL